MVYHGEDFVGYLAVVAQAGHLVLSSQFTLALEPLVTKKEICFFDLEIREYNDYHFLEFKNMFKKTELMIFTVELSNDYFDDLSDLNQDVLIVIDKSFTRIIKLLISD